MTFVHPLLLGGLLLVGVPILLHLILRQQPKLLRFPAMRFLMQRHKTNQRKLQLRHLLLLVLRILLIALMCLALARPKILSGSLNIGGERPVAAVLIFDTSFSMEYSAGGSRLDDAKKRGHDLLDTLPPDSRVTVLESADPADNWMPVSQARERIAGLQARAANFPVTTALGRAYDLLAALEQERDKPDDALLPFVYVFSDRMTACWDPRQVENLQRLRDRITAPKPVGLFVDVGLEPDKIADLAINNVELLRQAIAANEPLDLNATVQATGADYDTVITCKIAGQKGEDRQQIRRKAGDSAVVTFRRYGLPPGLHQAEISLATTDALPFNNVAYATFEVRGARKVLTVTDDPNNAQLWQLALEAGRDKGEVAFECVLLPPADAVKLSTAKLAEFQAVCLLSVEQPSADLWQKLERYVRDGGGLAVIPGTELNRTAYNEGKFGEEAFLPAKFRDKIEAKEGLLWDEASFQEPVKGWFRVWRQDANIGFVKFPPRTFRYWEVETNPQIGQDIVKYKRPNNPAPAVLERRFDPQTVRGRLLQFTVPLDDRGGGGELRWHNYLQQLVPFYIALTKKTVSFLAGDAEDAVYNYTSGQTIPVPLPPTQRFATYTLQGPGLEGAQGLVQRGDNETILHLTRATMPGNYNLFGDGQRIAGFSLKVAPEESQLTPVPPEQIETLFGENAILRVDPKTSLQEALQGHWTQPVELLPYLLILLLLALAVENLLANKFYRNLPADERGSTNRG